MEKIELFFNMIYYCLYKTDVKLHKLSNKINPILYLYKLPFAKKHFEKMGKNPEDIVNEAFEDPEKGLSIMFSGGLMIAISTLFFSGLSGFLCGILMINIEFGHQIIASGIIFILFCNLYLWRKDKHLKDFKKFDKMSKCKKYIWTLITLSFIITAIFIWWKGMVFWDREVGILRN